MATLPLALGGESGEGSQHEEFFALLRALADKYLAVVVERDQLKGSTSQPLRCESFPPPPCAQQAPQRDVATGPVQEALARLASKDRRAAIRVKDDIVIPKRAIPHVRAVSFPAESSMSENSVREDESNDDHEAVFASRSTIRIATPQALRLRKAIRDSAASTGVRGGRSTHISASRVFRNTFVLDRRWRDLYYANEHGVELEEGATLTFRQAALASLSSKRPSLLVSVPKVVGGRDGSLSLLSEMDAIAMNLSPLQRFRNVVPILPTDMSIVWWNLFGLVTLVYDAIMLPLSIAWDFDLPLWVSAGTSIYWSLDVVVRLNTGHYDVDGTLITERRHVTKAYLTTWFVFDVVLLAIDISMLSLPSTTNFEAFRIVSGIRLARLLRLLKASRIKSSIEDMMADFGMDKFFLTLGIFETMFIILLFAHFFACTWYYLGSLALRDGSESWLSLHDGLVLDEISGFYSKSLYWVLGHLVAAPVDATTAPQNMSERYFTIGLIFCSLLVVGGGISNMTNAIAELHRSDVEARDAKRHLRRRLRGTDRALIARVIRFAMHSMRRRHELSARQTVLDLLSQNLVTEIAVRQRRIIFEAHDLFAMIRDSHSQVFVRLCDAFGIRIFADHEVVFSKNTVSECFYCTLSGTFQYGTLDERKGSHRVFESLSSGPPSPKLMFGMRSVVLERPTGVCEISLYCKKLHQGELWTRTFADALLLSGRDFADCVSVHPACVGLVYRYAQELLGILSEHDGEWNYELFSIETVRTVCDKLRSLASPIAVDLDSPSLEQSEVKPFLDDLQCATDEQFLQGETDLCEKLAAIFPELDEVGGIYKKLGEDAERMRTLASICSFVWLARDDYERFTQGQSQTDRMTTEQWSELRQFASWADLSASELHAMLVFLVIRGLGKVKAFLQAMPFKYRIPEMVMQELLHIMPRQTPSKSFLDEHQITLLESCLEVHKAFNLAQLLQGENTPHQVAMLKELAIKHGPRVFKFSLLALVAPLFGIRGVESPSSALIMGNGMTCAVLTACQALMRLGHAGPGDIYWSFIVDRASRIGLPTQSEEELVICRLACLTRASAAAVTELTSSWQSLRAHERRVLVSHFLADGIDETVFVLTFLPAFLANARANHIIGLRRAFVVLVDLLSFLDTAGFSQTMEMPSITVNLQDLGPFTKEATNPRAFLAVMDFSKVNRRETELVLQISTQHKENVADAEWSNDTATETLAEVRHISRTLTSALDATAVGSRSGRPSLSDLEPASTSGFATASV